MRWFIISCLALMVIAGVAATLAGWPGGRQPATADSRPDDSLRLSPPISPPHQFARPEEKAAGPVVEPVGGPVTEPGAVAGLPKAAGAGEWRALDWEDLIPADWRPETHFEQYDLEALEDDDDLALELLDKLMEVWATAPVVEELDGQWVKLPGFVVPLDIDAGAGRISEFLLVPYFGACIHLPPPPANQTVYVKARDPKAGYELEIYATVRVYGTMRARRFTAELAEAGYTIIADHIEPYQDDSVVILE